MLELFLTISFSSLIIVVFRLINKLNVDELEAIVVNYFIAVIWGLLTWQESFSIHTIIHMEWFGISILIGVFFIITFFLLSKSAVQAGIAITAVASRMSVLIPVIIGFWIFHDRMNYIKIGGIILSIFSFLLIFKPASKMKFNFKVFLLPFLLFLGIGANDTMIKFVQHHFLTDNESLFLLVVFFVAFVIGSFLLLVRYFKRGKLMSLKGFLAGFILGSLNFGTTYFLVISMKTFENSVLFPVVNVGIVGTTALIAVLFFKEKLSRINWLGIFIAVIAIVLISMS